MTKVKRVQRVISKGDLKARMLEIFRELERNGGELIVTDRGRPTLRVVPIVRGSTLEDVFGAFQGKLKFLEDPDAPTVAEWEEP